MALPNPNMDFTPFDVLPASELDDLVENIEALAAGTGFNAGAIPSSAYADASVGHEKLKTTVSFLARRTTNQSIVSGSATKIVFATEVMDRGNNYDPASGLFTAPYPGDYRFEWQLSIDATGTIIEAILYQNATVVGRDRRYNNVAADDMAAGSSITIPLAAADTVEVRGLHNAGSNRDVLGTNVGENYFSGTLVGRL